MAKKAFSIGDYIAPGDVSKLDTAPKVEMIDIDLIDGNNNNFYDLSDLKPLADSIALDGLQQFPIVTAGADNPVRVTLISGHRRCAAIRMLVEDEKTPREDLRFVPCIRKTYSSPAMAELQLILANSTARVLTSVETMKQAERVEMLLYELKESGYDFPGRMRDHVAEACNVSTSKLARLKVIREKLIPSYLQKFEVGKLPEASAYEIARLLPEYQEHMFERVPDYVSSYDIEYLKDKFDIYFGPGLKCKRCIDPKNQTVGYCEHGAIMWEISKNASLWNMCNGCCADCFNLATCKQVCPRCKELAEDKIKKQNDNEANRAAERAAGEKCRELESKACKKTWLRIAKVCSNAGVSFVELKSKTNAYFWWNEEDAAECLAGEDDDYDIYDIAVLIPVADACGCSIDYLLCRTNNPAPLPSVPEVPNVE